VAGVKFIDENGGGPGGTAGSPITGYVMNRMPAFSNAASIRITVDTDDELAGIGVRLAKKKRGR
jgi:hypothetical protein